MGINKSKPVNNNTLANAFKTSYGALTGEQLDAIKRRDKMQIKTILNKHDMAEFGGEQFVDVTSLPMIFFAICMVHSLGDLSFVVNIRKRADLDGLDVLLLGLFYRKDISGVRVEFAPDFVQDFEFMTKKRTMASWLIKRHRLAVTIYNLAFDYSISVSPQGQIKYDHNTYVATVANDSHIKTKATGLLDDVGVLDAVIPWPEIEVPYSTVFRDKYSISYGAFGIVYRAEGFKPLDGKDVAFKLFTLNSNDAFSSWREYEGIVKELKMWLHLVGDKPSLEGGKYVIPLYAIYEARGDKFAIAAMPLMHTSVGNLKGYDLSFIKNVIVQMCLCVRHVHRKMVAHGDIKPDNFLLSAQNEVFICDFGESVLVEMDKDGSVGFPDDPDYEINVKGAQDFHAPEVVYFNEMEDTFDEQEARDAFHDLKRDIFKKDVWALGACIYELLYGELVNNETTLFHDTPPLLRRMLSHEVDASELGRPDMEYVCAHIENMFDSKIKLRV